jgi:hypothetical protein
LKSLRFSLFSAVLLALSMPAVAQVTCYTKPTNYPNTPYVYANGFTPAWRNSVDGDFSDYGIIFEDAKKRDCSLWAKEALKTKVQETNMWAIGRRHNHAGAGTTIPIPDNQKYEGIGPYQNWLEGAHVALASAAALAIGGHGDMTSELDGHLQTMITNFNSLPNRNVTYPVPLYYRYGLNTISGVGKRWRDDEGNLGGISADTAMDDHAIGAVGHAWAAAYQHKRGNTTSRDQNITKAKAALNDVFSLTEANGNDSICLFDPLVAMSATGRGPCNVTSTANIATVLGRTNDAQRGYTFSFNRHQNQAYGIGLMASVSAASVGLEEAGTTWSLTADQKLLLQAILEEAQRKAKSGLNDGEYFNGELGGFGTCASFSVVNGVITNPNTANCADTVQRPRMYALVGAPDPTVAPNTFFSRYVSGFTPKTTVYDREKSMYVYNAFQFNQFFWSDFKKDITGTDTTPRPHWARAVWFGNLAYYWHTKVSDPNPEYAPPTAGEIRPRLSAVYDDNNPFGYVDNIDTAGVARGWTCDPDLGGKSIWVDFYRDNVPGVGTYLGQARANVASESAVNTVCTGGGTAHRFVMQLPLSAKGHYIYVYALDATWRGYTLLPPSSASYCPTGLCIYP